MMEAAVYRRPTNYLKETTMLSKNRKSKRKCLLLDYPLIPFLQQRFQGNYIIAAEQKRQRLLSMWKQDVLSALC